MSRPMHRSITLRLLSALVVITLIGVIFGSIITNRLSRPLPSLVPQTIYAATSLPDNPVGLNWPSFGQSAVGIVGHGVLAVNSLQTPVPTASSAKLITALAVLKVKPIAPGSEGPTLTLSGRDVDYYNTYASEDGSVAPVNAGEQISEYQMLEGMLLPSANNLADSLAVWAFGSLSAYSSYANRMLKELQLLQTHVGNDASGFQADTTSTAADLVRIGEMVESNPLLAHIVAESSANIPVAGTVNNVNWLLGSNGIDGIKTGNSSGDQGVFLVAENYTVTGNAQVTIVGAVMKAPSLNAAMDSSVPLLKSAQKALGYTTTLSEGQAIGQYIVPWKSAVTAVTQSPVKALTWQGRPLGKPIISLHSLNVPQTNGAVVGTISYGSGLGGSTTLKLVQPISRPSSWWRLIHG